MEGTIVDIKEGLVSYPRHLHNQLRDVRSILEQSEGGCQKQQQWLLHRVRGYATYGKSLRPSPGITGSHRFWHHAGIHGANPADCEPTAHDTG